MTPINITGLFDSFKKRQDKFWYGFRYGLWFSYPTLEFGLFSLISDLNTNSWVMPPPPRAKRTGVKTSMIGKDLGQHVPGPVCPYRAYVVHIRRNKKLLLLCLNKATLMLG